MLHSEVPAFRDGESLSPSISYGLQTLSIQRRNPSPVSAFCHHEAAAPRKGGLCGDDAGFDVRPGTFRCGIAFFQAHAGGLQTSGAHTPYRSRVGCPHFFNSGRPIECVDHGRANGARNGADGRPRRCCICRGRSR